MAQVVKNLPAMQETWVQSPVGKILEEELATHSSILAWRIPWTEEPGRVEVGVLAIIKLERISEHSFFR